MNRNYNKIYACLDNSDFSNGAARLGAMICRVDDGVFYGSHAYAAKLHEHRFRSMESGLPEEYQREDELERQRQTHDSLITKGLEVITDCYLEVAKQLCDDHAVPFVGVTLEGRNWEVLANDIEAHDYDLIALGAHGLGRVPGAPLGSVAQRLLRRVKRDVLICKNDPEKNSSTALLVCLDGSSRSWGALLRGIHFARAFDKKLVAVSCFDPYFHQSVFRSLTGVLSSEARTVFRFEEQEKLHENIIDSGLAKIYQSHLDVAKRIGADEEIEIETHLLDGKPFEKILEFAERTEPWLIVMGRIGIHSPEDMDIGGNTENVCRLARCNVLAVNAAYEPPAEYTSIAFSHMKGQQAQK